MADVRTPEDMERLMDRYGDRMLRLCCMYLNDEHMAQDAVQDSFLKIYRNAQTFETPEMEKSWVMRVAINTCKDYLRSAWKRRVNLMEQLPEVPAPETVPRDDDGAIDHIAVMRDTVTVLSHRQLRTAAAAAATDHFPIWLDTEPKKKTEDCT